MHLSFYAIRVRCAMMLKTPSSDALALLQRRNNTAI